MKLNKNKYPCIEISFKDFNETFSDFIYSEYDVFLISSFKKKLHEDVITKDSFLIKYKGIAYLVKLNIDNYEDYLDKVKEVVLISLRKIQGAKNEEV